MLHVIRRSLHGCAAHLKQRDAIRSLQRLNDRMSLQRLNDRMLADFGIHRSQIQSVVRDRTSSSYL